MKSEQSSSFFAHLFFPLNLLRAGSILMLLYVCTVAFVCVGIVDFIQIQIARFIITMQQQEGLTQEVSVNLFIFGKALSWLIVAPALIASQSLPVRIIFLHDSMPIMETIKHSITAIKFTIQGIFYSLRWAPIYLIPLIAILLLERLLKEYLAIPLYQYSYYGVVIVIIVGVAMKLMPYFLIPITCVLSLSEPRAVHYKTALIFDRHTSLLILLAGSYGLISYLLEIAIPNLVKLEPYSYIGQLILACYFILVFSGFVVRELARIEIEEHELRQQRQT